MAVARFDDPSLTKERFFATHRQGGKDSRTIGVRSLACTEDEVLGGSNLSSATLWRLKDNGEFGESEQFLSVEEKAGKDRDSIGYVGVCCVSLDFECKTAAVCSGDGRVAIRDLKSRKKLGNLDADAWQVVFLDSDRLATAGPSGAVRFWDLRKLSDSQDLAKPTEEALPFAGERRHHSQGSSRGITALTASRNGLLISYGTAEGRCGLVDCQAGKLPRCTGEAVSAHEVQTGGLCFLESRRVVLSDFNERSICVLEPTRSGSLRSAKTFAAHEDRITSLASMPDAPETGCSYFVSTSWDHTVRLWDLDRVSEEPLCTFKSHQGYVWCSAYSPSGSFFVSGGADGKVCLYKPPGLDSANEEEDTHVEAG